MFIVHVDINGDPYVWEDDVYGRPPERFEIPPKLRLPYRTQDGAPFLWNPDEGFIPTAITIPQASRAPVVFSRDEVQRILRVAYEARPPSPPLHDSEPVLVPEPAPRSPYGRRPGTDIFMQYYPSGGAAAPAPPPPPPPPASTPTPSSRAPITPGAPPPGGAVDQATQAAAKSVFKTLGTLALLTSPAWLTILLTRR